jgi:hypothetical protein
VTLSIESRVDGRKVRFEAGGQWNLPDVFGLIERARDEADASGLARVLMDMRRVTGPIPDMERFFAGERVAAVLRNRIRLAVVAREEDINRFGENVAVNRGARIRVTSSEEEAVRWLEADSPR